VYDLVIEDGTLISGKGRRVADICVEDGRVVYIGSRPGGPARRTISAIGRFIVPGLVDTHVHFRDPGHPAKEDWLSGSRAAVSGGVTTVCDMPNTSPPTLTRADFAEKRALAEARSLADFGIWVGAAAGNVDEARALADGPAPLACGIKVFMGASTGPLLVDDATLVRFFEHTRALMGVHAEDERVLERYRESWAGRTPPSHHDSRPAEAARAAVARLVELTRAHPRPVHVCHVSTAAELEVLEPVRGRLPITTEVSPHHLWLSTNTDLGNFGKVNPPIRPEVDRRAMWAALKRGLVDTVGSDHAPHTREEKDRDYASAPSGMPGVETTFPLLVAAVKQGRIPMERVVQLCAENPARIFGFARKGRVEVGFDADLLVFSEKELVRFTAAQVLSRVGWSAFVGQRVAPKPDQVYAGGTLVAEAGAIVDETRRGRLVTPARGGD